MIETIVSEKKREIEERLPELVKRLVQTSCPEISYLRIPSNDDIWAPGFDGIINNKKETRYVASGHSVWEFGTNADSLAKINEDYKKRTENSLGIDKAQTVFYLVVPKLWAYSTPITEWERAHCCDWKDVHIYDASVLCDWINSEPSVAAWFLETFYEGYSLEFSSVDLAWNRLSRRTSPPLSYDIFTVGREQEIDNFLEEIDNKKICQVKGETMVDAYGFCLSALLKRPETAEKVIVIYNEETYYHLSQKVQQKIFLLHFPFSGQVSDCNKTILCFSRDSVVASNIIKLSPLLRSEFVSSVQAMGISYNDANELYIFTHGNLLSLIRRIPGNNVELRPQWADVTDIDLLRPIVFLRHYDSRNQEDQQVVSRLAGVDYQIVAQKYEEFLRIEDAPIKRIGSQYILINYEEAWMTLNIDINDLASQNLYQEILLRLSRLRQNNYRENSSISFQQLIYNYIMFSQTASDYNIIGEQVQKILEYFQIPTCREALLEVIPYLAEAAPSTVCSLINNEIETDYVYAVFSKNNIYHSGWNILYALDRLTVMPETCVLACRLLFKLCKLTKTERGSISTSPRESLLNALCLWDESSLLSLNKKKLLLESFVSDDKEFSIPFIIDLISKDQLVRGVRIGEKERKISRINRFELQKTRDDLAVIVFDNAFLCHRIDWIESILKQYIWISSQTIASKTSKFDIQYYTFEQLQQLQFTLHKLLFDISIYNRTSRRQWIGPLKEWINCLVASDSIGNVGWMFIKYFETPFDELLTIPIEDHELRENEAWKIREKVFCEIKKSFGIAGVLQLVCCMDDNHEWGKFLSSHLNKQEYIEIFKELVTMQKFNLMTGLLNYGDIESATASFGMLESSIKAQVLPNIFRKDIESWITDSTLKKFFWQSKSMLKYDENVYQNLIKYNPCGLLRFLYVEISNNTLDYKQLIEVFQAIANNCTCSENYLISTIIIKVDEFYYSDSWANTVLQLYDNNMLKGIYEYYPTCLQKYFFRNPSKMCTMFLKDRDEFREHFFYHYRLPEEAFQNYEYFRGWFDTLYKEALNQKGLLKYIGRILGRSLDDPDGIFPHKFIRETLEVYHNDDLTYEVVLGKMESIGFRTPTDGVKEQKIATVYKNNADSLEITYPETSKILKKLAGYYEDMAKSDQLYSEIGAIV